MPNGSRDQPLVSVDVVALAWRHDALQVLLARRQSEPYLGDLALPGVLLRPGERVQQAAYRALESKGDVRPLQVAWMGPGSFFDESNRDPRGATISLTMAAVLAPSVQWVHGAVLQDPGDAALRLPFDHETILSSTLQNVVAANLWRDTEMTRAILGPRFLTTSVEALHQRLDVSLGRGNLVRWLSGRPDLERDQIGEGPGVVGRPSARWKWHRTVE